MNTPAVRPVVNILDLLEYFAQFRQPASLGKIHRDLDLPRSSTYSMLQTLMAKGYLYEPGIKGEFYPSPKWQDVLQKITSGAPLSANLQSMLGRIRDQTNETCMLMVVSGDSAMFAAVEESSEFLRFTTPVGNRIPLHATASGRALLSCMDVADRQSLLNRIDFERFTENSPMTPDAVEAEIAKSLERGYFFTVGEHIRGTGGLAIPFTFEHRTAAVLVAGPTERITAAKGAILKVMARELQAAGLPFAMTGELQQIFECGE